MTPVTKPAPPNSDLDEPNPIKFWKVWYEEQRELATKNLNNLDIVENKRVSGDNKLLLVKFDKYDIALYDLLSQGVFDSLIISKHLEYIENSLQKEMSCINMHFGIGVEKQSYVLERILNTYNKMRRFKEVWLKDKDPSLTMGEALKLEMDYVKAHKDEYELYCV